MKKITLVIIFLVEAVLLAALATIMKRFPNIISSMLAFPFEQIAGGLVLVSGVGRIGKGIAAALWFGVSAIPMIPALSYERGKEARPERITLFVLSGVIFVAMYGMMNPYVFGSVVGNNVPEYTKTVKSVLGVSVWSVVVLYFILRLIRLFQNSRKEQLLKYLHTILYILGAVFAAVASFALTNGVLTLVETAPTALDRVAGGVLLIAEIIPYILDIVVIMRVLDLLNISDEDSREGIIEAAGSVSRICCVILGITVFVTAASNILQAALMHWLTNVSVTVNIPVISIAFIVLILLFTRLLVENKKLRDDNSLFI